MTSILVIAKTTLGEALRKKVLNIFLIVALAMLALPFSFASFTFSANPEKTELTIINSFGLGIIAIAGMFIVVVLGINLVSSEIEKRTIFTILSKPVRRHEFLLGKFLGALMTLAVNLVLMSIVFVLMVTWKSHWQPQFGLFKGIMMIFFQLFLLSSIATLFSVCTTPVINFFLTSTTYIVGSLSAVTEGMAKSPDNSEVIRLIYKVIHYLAPNFANFNTQNPLIHPEVVIKNEWSYYGYNMIYAIVYVAIMLILAVLIFEKRDM